jgi:acyl-CoA synthetase (AMP-forming)/AMP-acid ligase II
MLAQHPSAAAAAVFGVPDDRLGERVVVLIVPAEPSVNSASLVSFCSGRVASHERDGQDHPDGLTARPRSSVIFL